MSVIAFVAIRAAVASGSDYSASIAGQRTAGRLVGKVSHLLLTQWRVLRRSGSGTAVGTWINALGTEIVVHGLSGHLDDARQEFGHRTRLGILKDKIPRTASCTSHSSRCTIQTYGSSIHGDSEEAER